MCKIKREVIRFKRKIPKGRIEPGTRHGSRPHKNRAVYSRKTKYKGDE